MSPENQRRCRTLAAQFAGEKQFYPRGVPWNQEKSWTVAALAVLPVLHLGLDTLRDFSSLYILPRNYRVPQVRQEGYLETEAWEDLSGEVMETGALVLAWEDVKASGQGRGFNVVVHEIAHVLDGGNGRLDGCPRLKSREQEEKWVEAFTRGWDDLCSRKNRDCPIDPYAGESPEEFFAVVLEEFFDRPARLKKTWPDIFQAVNDWWLG